MLFFAAAGACFAMPRADADAAAMLILRRHALRYLRYDDGC